MCVCVCMCVCVQARKVLPCSRSSSSFYSSTKLLPWKRAPEVARDSGDGRLMPQIRSQAMRTGCPTGAARTVLEQTSGMGFRLPWYLDRRLPLAASGLPLAVCSSPLAGRPSPRVCILESRGTGDRTARGWLQIAQVVGQATAVIPETPARKPASRRKRPGLESGCHISISREESQILQAQAVAGQGIGGQTGSPGPLQGSQGRYTGCVQR